MGNHIANNAFTIYDGNDPNDIYCTGFAYEADSFGDDVKYNTLFHMAMKTNLYDKGYVGNVPGAPLCGCIEQMPIVDGADCVKAVEGYKLGSDGSVLSILPGKAAVNLESMLNHWIRLTPRSTSS